MKKLLFKFLLAGIILQIFSFTAFGQSNEANTSFTLEQCVDYALNNAISIQDAKIDAQIAKAQVGEIRATGLPQVNGSVQVSHSDPLRRMYITSDNPIVGGGANGLPPGTVLALPNIFQLPSSGDAGISISQLIFSGSYIVGLQAAKTYQELTTKAASQSRIETIEQVTKAYYTVLINKERLKLFENNIARVDSFLRNTKGLQQEGFSEKIEVDRVQVALNNLIIEREKFKDLVKLSYELLKYQMNYPMHQELNVEGTVREVNLRTMSYDTLENNFDYANRVEYSILQTQEALQRLDLKHKTSEYLPTLSAFANLGYFTQSQNIGGLFRTESSLVPDTPEFGPDKWYGYGTFGVTLNVPIFDGLGRSYRVQQSRLNLRKVENGFINLRNSIDLQVNQSRINLSNSLKTLDAHEDNVGLAEEVARVTKIKYNEGVGSNFEVTEAESALREAQNNYYNALYDAIIAQIDLQVALGVLAK